MENSFDVVLRGTKRKESSQGKELLAHRDEVIAELTDSIAKGEYKVSSYRNREIVEHGKVRTIQILSMKDRIAVHAITVSRSKQLSKPRPLEKEEQSMYLVRI